MALKHAESKCDSGVYLPKGHLWGRLARRLYTRHRNTSHGRPMKLLTHKLAERAFTVAEMGVAVGALGLLGVVFFQVLQSGLTLSAKDTAANAAREEARGASVVSHSDIRTAHAMETNVKNNPHYAGTHYAITYYTKRVMYLV